MASWLQMILENATVSRVRRNHGLEHATLHLLAQRYPRRSMAGYSTPSSFLIIGRVPTEAVTAAVYEALARMRAGEESLAVHPNCGTNFVTGGTLAGIAGAFAMWGAGPRLRDKLERLSLATTLATLALILAQPLGNLLQARITTSGQPGDLEIVQITPLWRGGIPAHQITTRG